MNVIHIRTEAEFEELISKNKHVVVDFYTTWCPPCRMMAPIVEKLSSEFTEVVFAKVNLEEKGVRMIGSKFEISAVPTFIYFKDGKPVSRIIGAIPEPIFKQWIKEKL